MASFESSFSFVLLIVCLFAGSSGSRTFRRRSAGADDSAQPLVIQTGPINTANYVGEMAKLHCQADPNIGLPRVQWWEYNTNTAGTQISDGVTILPGHPYESHYTLIVNTTTETYDLYINSSLSNDAGLYGCKDLNDGSQLYAQLVVIDRQPNCTSTLPANAIVNEGAYYTIECQVFFSASQGIAPYLFWTGPGTYNQGYLAANGSAWAGVSFYVNKTMDGKSFKCYANFTTAGFGGTNTASNAPTWTYTYTSPLLYVQYGPQNISYTPVQQSYEIGQVLRCNADSVPLPTFKWTNMLTAIDYNSQTLTITEDMVGFLMLRCQAINSVSSANIFFNTTVNPHTTTTAPPPSTTTTPVPAVTKCSILTGRWEATRSPTSTIVLCLTVDTSQNGLIRGLLQNDTNEPYLTELIGRTRNYEYDEAGWTGIWPERIGVSSYAAECHRCYEVETMQVSLISRSSADHVFCDGGTVLTSPQFTFYRVPMADPCTTLASEMETSFINQPRRHKRDRN